MTAGHQNGQRYSIFRELVPVVGLADRPVGVDGCPALVTALRCYEPVAIYLFGSRARGTARPDSDFDLALFLGDSRSFPSTSGSRLPRGSGP